MNNYGPLLQQDGADLGEASNAEDLQPDVDAGGSFEKLPGDSSCQNTVQRENVTNITVQAISFYGSGEILSVPQNLSLKPESHPPERGSIHYMSARYLARISDRDVDTVVNWARTGSCFLQLEFCLTGHDFPRFKIRVLVVEDQVEGISLSDGLGFAHRLLKLVQDMDADRPRAAQRQQLPLSTRKRLLDRLRSGRQGYRKTVGPGCQLPPLTLRDRNQSARSPRCPTRFLPSVPPASLLSRSLPSLHDLDDQYSVSTDNTEDSLETPPLTRATTETNWLDGPSESGGILNSSPGDLMGGNFHLDGDADQWASCHVKGRPLTLETLENQKKQAQTMYTYNGDTSGMVSLMTLATADPFINYSNLYYDATQN